MSYYTINDFETLMFSGFQYNLPQNVLDIIKQIDCDLRENMHLIDEYKPVNGNTQHYSQTHSHPNGGSSAPNYKYNGGNSSHIQDKKRIAKKEPYYKGKPGLSGGNSSGPNANYQKKEVTNSDWENLRNYKLTKVEQMEGITKSISEVRTLINKISDKTYNTCKDKIVELVDKFMEEYADSEETEHSINAENRYKMCISIFEIMVSNKFNSKLNAELYAFFMDKYSIFKEIVDKYVSEFKNTIENIENVDPDKDYDAYCINVKKNDLRKSATIFMMNLFKYDKIDAVHIMDIIEYFLDKTVEYIDIENMTYVVEEITENIFLMVTSQMEKLGEYEKWKNSLYTKIIHISNMKANQHPSLTNRVVFKYMDIIDSL